MRDPLNLGNKLVVWPLAPNLGVTCSGPSVYLFNCPIAALKTPSVLHAVFSCWRVRKHHSQFVVGPPLPLSVSTPTLFDLELPECLREYPTQLVGIEFTILVDDRFEVFS